MSLAITGASGQLGRYAAELLLDAVDPADVVLTTRKPESLDDLAARGATVRRADFDDAASLKAAFAGVEGLLLVSTDSVGTRLAGQQSAIAAAAEAGVRQVVYTSVPEPVADNPALVVPDHKGTEEALRASGLAWTFLRNNLYSHMQIPGLQHAAEAGQLVTNSGAGRAAYVTREDCAAVAVAALTHEGHANKTYDVTGAEALSAEDLALLASRLGSRAVEVVNVDDAAYLAGLAAAGLPEPLPAILESFGRAIREGYLATVSTVVQDLTGKAPASLASLV